LLLAKKNNPQFYVQQNSMGSCPKLYSYPVAIDFAQARYSKVRYTIHKCGVCAPYNQLVSSYPSALPWG